MLTTDHHCSFAYHPKNNNNNNISLAVFLQFVNISIFGLSLQALFTSVLCAAGQPLIRRAPSRALNGNGNGSGAGALSNFADSLATFWQPSTKICQKLLFLLCTLTTEMPRASQPARQTDKALNQRQPPWQESRNLGSEQAKQLQRFNCRGSCLTQRSVAGAGEGGSTASSQQPVSSS